MIKALSAFLAVAIVLTGFQAVQAVDQSSTDKPVHGADSSK